VTKLTVYDIKGKPTGEVAVETIPEGFEPDKVLIARSLKRQLGNARIRCAHVKTRSEVRGGGRKPFRQKGLGRSRQGSIRAIQWTGGGVAWGPSKTRDFKTGMNKKERKAALRHVIWSKMTDESWLLFGDIKMKEPSTKKGRAFIESLGREGKFLVLLPERDEFENLRKSLRNLPEVMILAPERLNTYDLMRFDTILAHEEAFETVRNIWKV